MVPLFKVCFVWLVTLMASDATPLVTFKNPFPNINTNTLDVLPICWNKFGLMDQIRLWSHCSYLLAMNEINFVKFTTYKMKIILRKFSIDASWGPDMILATLPKNCADRPAPIFRDHVFTWLGYFWVPRKWKSANVILSYL